MKNDLFELVTIMIFIIAFGSFSLVIYYGIYNPIIKVKDGCWSWERETIIEVFSLIDDYNLICKDISEAILLELYYPMEDNTFIDTITYTKCKDKEIYITEKKCFSNCFKEQYKERCL